MSVSLSLSVAPVHGSMKVISPYSRHSVASVVFYRDIFKHQVNIQVISFRFCYKGPLHKITVRKYKIKMRFFLIFDISFALLRHVI